MPVNIRDEQVVRESVIQGNPNVRNQQVTRETVFSSNPNVRNFQVFRESIIPAPGTGVARFFPVTFVTT